MLFGLLRVYWIQGCEYARTGSAKFFQNLSSMKLSAKVKLERKRMQHLKFRPMAMEAASVTLLKSQSE